MKVKTKVKTKVKKIKAIKKEVKKIPNRVNEEEKIMKVKEELLGKNSSKKYKFIDSIFKLYFGKKLSKSKAKEFTIGSLIGKEYIATSLIGRLIRYLRVKKGVTDLEILPIKSAYLDKGLKKETLDIVKTKSDKLTSKISVKLR